jgi:hypothetical protein
MINVSTGVITFDDGMCISPDDLVGSIELLPGAKNVTAIQGRRQYALGSHTSKGQIWGVGVVFIESALRQVWMQCLTCVGNADLSLQTERLRQDFHDGIFEKIRLEGVAVKRVGVNLEANFPWGKLSSVLDPRGVQALLIASYI